MGTKLSRKVTDKFKEMVQAQEQEEKKKALGKGTENFVHSTVAFWWGGKGAGFQVKKTKKQKEKGNMTKSRQKGGKIGGLKKTWGGAYTKKKKS